MFTYLRLVDSCITQLNAQGPSRTCNESKEEEKEGAWIESLPGLEQGNLSHVNGQHQTPNTKHKTKKHNTQNMKHKTQNTKHHAWKQVETSGAGDHTLVEIGTEVCEQEGERERGREAERGGGGRGGRESGAPARDFWLNQ